jgi:hypothetical protein
MDWFWVGSMAEMMGLSRVVAMDGLTECKTVVLTVDVMVEWLEILLVGL